MNQPVIVYLAAGVLRGGLQTLHPRVLDELHDASGNLTVRDVHHGETRAGAHLQNQSVVLSKRHVLLVVDLVPLAAGSNDVHVARECYTVTLAVGPYWVSGTLHLPIGIDPFAYLDGNGVGFTALTGAHEMQGDPAQQRTFLINRRMISGLVLHTADMIDDHSA